MRTSVIIPCKNRLPHLKESLPFLLKQDYEELEIIVVDYNCPQKTGQWIQSLADPRIKIVNALVGEDEWSLSAARNFGYKYASGHMLFFMDADAKLLWPDFISVHLQICEEGTFICGWGYHDATGCCMLRKKAFEAVSGYNEAIKSWGMEDIDLYQRLEKDKAQERRVWIGGIETIKHEDSLRNHYHNNAPIQVTNELNFHISQTNFIGIYGKENKKH